MTLFRLITAAAAVALFTGAAHAQTAETTAPATSVSETAINASTGASVTTTMTTNGPVPDTAENRAKYGQPMSRAGKRTAARGN